MSTMVSQITSLTIVYSIVYYPQIKENNKAPCHWPLCWEFTGDKFDTSDNWAYTQLAVFVNCNDSVLLIIMT